MPNQIQNYVTHRQEYKNFKQNAVLVPQQQLHMTPGNFVDMVTPNFADRQNQSFRTYNYNNQYQQNQHNIQFHHEEIGSYYKSYDEVKEPGYPPFPPLNYLQNNQIRVEQEVPTQKNKTALPQNFLVNTFYNMYDIYNSNGLFHK